MDKKGLEAAFGGSLVAAGFKKKGSAWYRQAEDALQIVDLQRSSYGPQFFVNLCCVPSGMAVEGMPTPKEHKCPVRIRLTAAFPKDHADIESVFDLDSHAFSDEVRAERLRELASHSVLSFMTHMRSSSALREAISIGAFKGGAVNLAARQHLGLD